MIRTWTPENETPPTPPGTVDYRTVKAWFQQLRDTDAEIESVKLAIRRLKDSATSCTASMSGMPGGGGVKDRVGACAEKIDTEEHRLAALVRHREKLQAEAIYRISCITGTKSSVMMQASLTGFYVDGRKQADIARSLLLPEENRVSLYIREGAKYLARIWDRFEVG